MNAGYFGVNNNGGTFATLKQFALAWAQEVYAKPGAQHIE